MILRFIKKFFIAVNVVVCMVYLLTCLSPLLNTKNWPVFGFFSLFFPYLLLLLVFSIFFWLVVKPKISLLPLLVLLAGYKFSGVLFAVHARAKFTAVKAPGHLRIVDWNVANMYGLSQDAEKRKQNRVEVAQAILKLQPDIICLQEFNNSTLRGPDADNLSLFTLTYPWFYFSKDINKQNGYYQYGSIIFSKLPLTDSGRIQYPGRPESLIYADVALGADTFRVYTSHLQSFKFNKFDYADMDKIANKKDDAVDASKNLYQKMKLAFAERGKQAGIVRSELDSCQRTSIICGDFNDVPGSFTYFNIRNNRQDAFLAKSFGLGRSYLSLAPTLRIDYILPDTNFTIHQFDMVDEDLSDHIMLVTDVSLKK